jgi:hypothetical protein
MPKSVPQRRRQLYALLGDLPRGQTIAFLAETIAPLSQTVALPKERP